MDILTSIGNGRNTLNIIRNYLMKASNKLTRMIFNFLRECNNKLNIYTEIKKEYKIQNNEVEKLLYKIVVNDGRHKSIEKILVISEKSNKQQNYFSC